LSSADWAERKYWNDYQVAYGNALSRCSTNEAPWYIVPANRKWYRNLLVARTLVSTMRRYKKEWQAKLVERGEHELALIEKLRQAEENPVEVNALLHS
ncbi:MAG: polyphosphate kinase 2 family protein, partial [Ktedonobacteraceae bacterium]